MKKVIKFVIVALFILIVVSVLGLFIFLKTVDINRFKAQITQGISESIGRDVTMKHVAFNFSLSRGVTLSISGLTVMDYPDFSSSSMFYIDSAHLDIDILPFLLKRQVLVSKVELNSLNVNLIRNRDGEINFQEISNSDIGQPVKVEEAVLPASEVPSRQKAKEESRDINFGEMLIRSIHITDGTFVFTDQTVTPPLSISITQFELQISNLSFDAPFPFRVTASLWSDRENIRLNGLAQINIANQQLRIDDLKIQTKLSDLSLDRAYSGVPALKEIGLRGGIEGGVLINVHQMVFGQGELLVLSLDGQLSNGKMRFKDFPVPIENLDVRFSATESDVEIEEMEMSLASGEAEMSGRIIEYLAEQKFLIDLNLKDVQLNKLLADLDLPVKLEGQLYKKFKLSGQGLNEDALKFSLTGDGSFEIRNGRVLDVNVLKSVLSKISFIPNLANRIEQNLPEKYKETLKAKDTILEKVEANMQIRDGVLLINKAEVSANGFLVTANGKLDFDQNLSLDADFYISSDLSASIVASFQELSLLLDESGRIHIPFKSYSGDLAHFVMYPDIEDIGKEFIRNKGKEELRKIIFRALDLDDVQGPPVDGQQLPGGERQPQEREISPEEAIIENILDMIPIFH